MIKIKRRVKFMTNKRVDYMYERGAKALEKDGIEVERKAYTGPDGSHMYTTEFGVGDYKEGRPYVKIILPDDSRYLDYDNGSYYKYNVTISGIETDIDTHKKVKACLAEGHFDKFGDRQSAKDLQEGFTYGENGTSFRGRGEPSANVEIRGEDVTLDQVEKFLMLLAQKPQKRIYRDIGGEQQVAGNRDHYEWPPISEKEAKELSAAIKRVMKQKPDYELGVPTDMAFPFGEIAALYKVMSTLPDKLRIMENGVLDGPMKWVDINSYQNLFPLGGNAANKLSAAVEGKGGTIEFEPSDHYSQVRIRGVHIADIVEHLAEQGHLPDWVNKQVQADFDGDRSLEQKTQNELKAAKKATRIRKTGQIPLP